MLKRYACVRQHDQSDCGAAVLATIAMHYKLRPALQKIRDLSGTDRIGTTMLGLVKAAEKIGFSAKGAKGEYDELSTVPLPCIAHIVTEQRLGHFIVLHRVEQDYVIAADPAQGIVKIEREAFKKLWTGYVAILVPDRGELSVEVAGQAVPPARRFFSLVRPHMGIMGEAFVAALLLTLLGLASSFFIQHLVDSVLVHSERRLLNALGVGMALVLVFRVLLSVFRRYLLAHLARKIDLSLISSYTRHVLTLPMNFFEMRRTGEILSRVNDAAKIRSAISGVTLTTLVDGTLLMISATIMFFYDWQLALVACLFAPVLVAVIMALHRPVRRISRKTMEDAALLQSHLVEDITGVDTIKSFRLEAPRAEASEDKLIKVVQNAFGFERIAMTLSATSMVISGLSVLVILWYGGHRVMDGALTIGQLMFFNTLMGNVLGPVESLASVNLSFQDALIAIDRLHEFLDIESEGAKDEAHAELGDMREGIEFHGVNFRYGFRPPVLKNLNMTIPAGSTVAIVGESGSGKTTLMKLLSRFYDPTEGSVTIDGRDLREYSLASLRSRIGLVSQEPFIFNGSIAENIALGRRNATRQEVVDAAHVAGLRDFIASLPQGYETVIGERGANLSGGQRQRMAIARAILMKPDILVFDEATSHLDTATERAIQHNLNTVFRDRTAVLVAHRLSTIREADIIYVMRDGEIVERGSHEQLVAQGGYYCSLWRSQIDGQSDGDAPLVVEMDSARLPAVAASGVSGASGPAPAPSGVDRLHDRSAKDPRSD